MSKRYQLTILGGGPGGYLAALRAGSLGLKTALIEKESLGGVCLNHGCIPTKVLTHGAALYRRLQQAGEYGFSFKDFHFSYPRLQEKKKTVVGELVKHVGDLLDNFNVEIYKGQGQALSPHLVVVSTEDNKQIELVTDSIIIATGSEEIYPPTPGLDLPGIMTSKEALAMERLPGSMAVIGGGVIALEMASIFGGLGVDVTIVHRSERLLRRMDQEMVRRLSAILRKSGLKVLMNAPIRLLEKEQRGYSLFITGRKGEETVKAESVLLAVGRKPSFGGLDLEGLGVEYGPGGISVNSRMETSAPGIYAVGDVTSPNYYLAHTAYHQGLVAAENIAGREAHFDGTTVPACLFTDPELASVGLSEEEARAKGCVNLQTGKFPFSANGKARTQSDSEGVVKIITSGEENRVIGVHILGPHASDLILEGALAVARGVSAADLCGLIHPHPTLGESVWEAAMAIEKSALHLVRK